MIYLYKKIRIQLMYLFYTFLRKTKISNTCNIKLKLSKKKKKRMSKKKIPVALDCINIDPRGCQVVHVFYLCNISFHCTF